MALPGLRSFGRRSVVKGVGWISGRVCYSMTAANMMNKTGSANTGLLVSLTVGSAAVLYVTLRQLR